MKDDSMTYKDLQELLYWNIDKLQEKDKEIDRLHSIINNTIKYCEESNLTLKSHYFMDVIKILKGDCIDEKKRN